MKKILPLLISILFFSIIIFFWDNIKLPYDESNVIVGNYYYNKINPLNDLIRFIVLITIPTLVYLFFYLNLESNFLSINLKSKNYFLNNLNLKEKNSLNKYLKYFFFLLIIEFYFIDFKQFLFLDKFHDSIYLTPPLNFIKYENFFLSTLYDYGLFGNNFGLIFFKLFGYYTLGAVKFSQLIIIFLIKTILLFISKLLVESLNLKNNPKHFFFIIFTFLLISLPNYYDFNANFPPRSLIYLIFIYIACLSLIKVESFFFVTFLLGFFSSVSMLWWFDIGIYTNFLILILSVYFWFHSQKKKILFLLLGLLISWLTIFIYFPILEIKSFFYNLKFIISTSDYLIGIEYLKPFSEKSARWTKALIIIYLTSLLLINLNFNKKYNISRELKLSLNFIFISSIILFKSALTRSDAPHIRYSAGLYTLVFIFILLYLIFFYLNKNRYFLKYYNNFIKKIEFKFIILIFILSSSLYFHNNLLFDKHLTSRLKNLSDFQKDLSYLIKSNETVFFEKEDLSILEKYKQLSNTYKDTCLQYFTDDNYFPYYIDKPTCTKFYLSNQIINNESEEAFLNAFKKKLPNIILFESPSKILLDKKNFPKVTLFLKKNYKFHENFKGYIFYKKNNF